MKGSPILQRMTLDLRSLLFIGFPVLVFVMVTEVTGACDPNTGPAGGLRCVRSSIYNNQSQYATCLTNSYIILKSKGDHSCLGDNNLYCYYQCMLDMYDKENGIVYPDCQCNPETYPNNPLPPECYSPSGTDSGWYLTCLEKKLRCSGGLDSYVMAFSHKLSTLAEGNAADVTQTGLRWLDATRKCLQVELAPLLLPFESVTCTNVSAHAYLKQELCYSKPYVGEPGICSVSSADFWKIFWATKKALGLKFVESLLGLLKTKSKCSDGLALDPSMYVINIRLQLPYLSRQKRDVSSVSKAINSNEISEETPVVMATRRKRHSRHVPDTRSSRARRAATTDGVWQGETNQQRDDHELAHEAGLSLNRLLLWDDQEVIWFAYSKETSNNTVLDMSLLFAERHAYNLQANPWSPRANILQLVTEAGQAFSGSGTYLVTGNQKAVVLKFQACSDINCQQVVMSVCPTNAGSDCADNSANAAGV